MNDIGFNDEMRALVLAGNKTQTRRLMKTQLKYGNICGIFPSWYLPTSATGGILWPNAKDQIAAMNPYGQPGERLLVRGTQEQIEIVSVRAERLQGISRGDAMGEGCPFPNMAKGDDPRQWFGNLWQQIYGADSWDANPWVYAIEFKRVTS
jgi:hypothetical protein